MHKINWDEGEYGKGVVDMHGVIHGWNEDEYAYHHNYLSEHPDVNPIGYYYIDPKGSIEVTFPSKGVDGHVAHDDMMDRITAAHPLWHPAKDPV